MGRRSPGGSFGELPHISRPRNPLIADALFRASYIDLWGYGTLKIFKTCEDAGLPKPEIQEIFGGMMVILNQQSPGGQMGGAIELTNRQSELLQHIQGNNSISRSELSTIMNINESAVQKHLDNLKKKGIIERIGGTRGYWQVNLAE